MSNLNRVCCRYYNEIFHFVYSRIENKHIAEEIVQDIFLKACENEETIVPLAENKKKVWFLTVAKNRCIDYWRKVERLKKRVIHEQTTTIEEKMVEGSSEEKVIAKERSQFLNAMLQKLKKEHQLAIILFDFNGLSYKESAERLNISAEAFGSLLQRARKALLEIILQETNPDLLNLPLTGNEIKTLASWFDLLESPTNIEEKVAVKSKMFFNGIGRSFEQLRNQMYPKGMDDHLLNLVPLKKKMTVADFGCGTGTFSKKASYSVSTVYAVDHSIEMIHALEDTLLQNEITNIVPLCLDVTKDLSEIHNKVDVAYCSMLLHHIFDPKVALKNIAHTLVSGGHLIIADLTYTNKNWIFKDNHDFWSGFKISQLTAWVEEAGLEMIEIKEDHSRLFQFEDVKEEEEVVSVPLLTAVCKKTE